MQNSSAQTECGHTSIGSVRNASGQIGAAVGQSSVAAGCQRTGYQNTEETIATILEKDSTKYHARKKNAGPDDRYRSGLDRSRRHRAFVMREVPLYMLSAAIRRGVRERGGKIYRAVILRTHWNHYTIKIRCSTKKAAGHLSRLRAGDRTLETFFPTEADDDG